MSFFIIRNTIFRQSRDPKTQKFSCSANHVRALGSHWSWQLWDTGVYIQQPFIKKFQTFVWHRINIPRLLFNWKKHKQGIQLCYSNLLLVSMNVSDLFLIKFWKSLILYLGCVVWLLILRHKWLQATSYSLPLNKRYKCKDHQIYSQMLREICKKEV